MEKFRPPNGEISSSKWRNFVLQKWRNFVLQKWRNFVLQMEKFRPPKVEKFCPPSGEILSPKWRNFVPQVEKFCPPSKIYCIKLICKKIRINTRLFYDFFIHFSCTEICIRLVRLTRLITGTPPPLDGRGAVPYSYRYLQKNQTTKKYQFLFCW